LVVLRPLALDVDAERSSSRMQDAGADIVVTNVKDAVEAIERLLNPTQVVRLKSDPQEATKLPASGARRSSAS
jgi:hypothetical protein